MKFKKFAYAAMVVLLASTSMLSSCSDDDDEPGWKKGSQVNLAQTRAFILNEGSQNHNNSNLIYFDWAQDSVLGSCIYTLQNGEKLGDTGNDLKVYGDKLLITVNGSNYLAMLNGSGVKLSTLSFENYSNLGTIRNVAAADGYAYVTSYGGYLSKIRISGNTLTYVDSLKIGSYPESVVVEDGKIYCAISGWGSDNRVAVVDANDFDNVTYQTVMANPDNIVEEDDRFFVQGYGQLYDYPWGELDVKTGTFTQIGNASAICAEDDKVYTAYSATDWSTYETTTTFAVYDLKTNTLDEAFFKNVPEDLTEKSVYGINVNPYTNEIYVTTTDYYSDGIIYKFAADGTYEKQFSSYGINPSIIVFLR